MSLLGSHPSPPLPRPADPPYNLEEARIGRGRVTHYVVEFKPHLKAELDDCFHPSLGYRLGDLPLCGIRGVQRTPLPRSRPCKTCESDLEMLELDLGAARWAKAERLAWPAIDAAIREAVRARAGDVGF